ncbi:uncharacterized protein LOC111349023 [Spodoptera litura]|uniref:Uncharacterized protein LOC111349023 n=1 Tax=Spodoptera litura TaxID=69820 RepID=A0A9J7DT17_SPOLT|nr:uncharacterized protein LOC111349023 [Spodoptera litura]
MVSAQAIVMEATTPQVLVTSTFLEMFTSFLKMSSQAGIIIATMEEMDEMKTTLSTQQLRTLDESIQLELSTTLQNRLKTLKILLQSNSVSVNITGRNDIDMTIRNVKKSLHYYNGLLDSLMVADIQLQLMSLKIILLTDATECVYSLFMLAVPAIVVELATSEVDEIKKILTIQLLKASDESLQFELETALQYVSLRPFQYTICRVIPLNLRVPFSVAGICITYTIVLLQLTLFT